MVKLPRLLLDLALKKTSRQPALHPSCSTTHMRHTLPKLSIWCTLQLVERYQELQRINNSSQNMSCKMGWTKHPWKSHGHNKQKPGKSPAFAPQLPALPTLLAMPQPCCTSNVRNSRSSSIATTLILCQGYPSSSSIPEQYSDAMEKSQEGALASTSLS